MILSIDIGNTNIRCALGTSQNYKLAKAETSNITNADNFAAFIQKNFMKEMPQVTGGVFSSVVPHKNTDILKALKGIAISQVDITKMGVDFTTYKSAIGQDRAVCAAMAAKKHRTPIVVIDFGTATTINIVDENRTYMGGAILAGVQTGINALARGTARLPQLDLSGGNTANINPIGTDTQACIISGAVLGAAYAAEGYVRHIETIFAKKHMSPPTIIITGGNATKVIPHCNFNYIHEPNLLIEGLFMHYEDTR